MICKVQIFWEGPQNLKKSPNFFANAKHEWDFSNFCGLLRISELYITPKEMFCIRYPLSYSLQDRKKMKQTYLHLYEHRLHRLPSMQCYQIESKVSNHFYCMHKNLPLTCIHRVSIKIVKKDFGHDRKMKNSLNELF